MTVHCRLCNHEWTIAMRLPIPLARATTAMKGAVAAGCPQCGSHGDYVLCGPAAPVDGPTESVAARGAQS